MHLAPALLQQRLQWQPAACAWPRQQRHGAGLRSLGSPQPANNNNDKHAHVAAGRGTGPCHMLVCQQGVVPQADGLQHARTARHCMHVSAYGASGLHLTLACSRSAPLPTGPRAGLVQCADGPPWGHSGLYLAPAALHFGGQHAAARCEQGKGIPGPTGSRQRCGHQLLRQLWHCGQREREN